MKGDAYEGLLQKNAEDVKGGAGQYFTPRPLIAAIVDVIRPEPGQAICDPACGTGGFLLAAHDYLAKHHALDRAQKKKLKSGTFYGIELVDSVTRLWIYDLRTNLHFTLKENTLKRTDLDDFVACYFGGARAVASKAGTDSAVPSRSRHDRKASERFRAFTYEELTKRDKVNLDIFWHEPRGNRRRKRRTPA